MTTPNTDPAGIPVRMIRAHMRDLPQFALPADYAIRNVRAGEGPVWEAAWKQIEPYGPIPDGLFAREFGDDPARIEERCFFLESAQDGVVGTISGWNTAITGGPPWGHIHWVGVMPAHQGKGLCKAIMSHAMNFLAQRHDRCFLDTATARAGAIKVYLDFGFLPDMTYPNADAAWAAFRETLSHPALGN